VVFTFSYILMGFTIYFVAVGCIGNIPPPLPAIAFGSATICFVLSAIVGLVGLYIVENQDDPPRPIVRPSIFVIVVYLVFSLAVCFIEQPPLTPDSCERYSGLFVGRYKQRLKRSRSNRYSYQLYFDVDGKTQNHSVTFNNYDKVPDELKGKQVSWLVSDGMVVDLASDDRTYIPFEDTTNNYAMRPYAFAGIFSIVLGLGWCASVSPYRKTNKLTRREKRRRRDNTKNDVFRR
jgi:hypothetical protein